MEGRILRCSGHLQEEVLMWEEEIGADGCSRCTGGRRMFVSSEDEEEEVERRRGRRRWMGGVGIWWY